MKTLEEFESEMREAIHNEYGFKNDDRVDAIAYALHYYKPLTVNGTIELLKKAGIKRAKIRIEYINEVVIRIPKKSVKDVKKLMKKMGGCGIIYHIKPLWFFECWFKKYKVKTFNPLKIK